MANASVSYEIVINHQLAIPIHKPAMERLLEFRIDYKISKAEVIATKMTTNNPVLPLRKVVVVGEAFITIKYVALTQDQQVHGAHFTEPFSALIEWPGGPPPGTRIRVEVIPEHEQIHKLDERHLSKVIVLQLAVTVNTSGIGGDC